MGQDPLVWDSRWMFVIVAFRIKEPDIIIVLCGVLQAMEETKM